MREIGPVPESGFWLAPVIAGVLLILMGVLIYKYPELLQFGVATIFVVLGSGLIAIGWKMRRRITYRRIDRQEDGLGDP